MKCLGLDLGTSTSCIAAVRSGQAAILSVDDRDRIIPSVVGIEPLTKEIVVGRPAKDQLETNPEYTFYGLKRLLGRKFDDPHVKEWADRVSYEVAPGPSGEAYVRGPDRLYSPVELLAHIVAFLKRTAQQALSEQVDKCVIGAPAHFDDIQKEAMREAARKGGLEPVRLLSEPVAAAVAYGVERSSNRTLAIYDFGGGTFDVTILKIIGQKFRPLATGGDAFLGGEDIDQRIVEWLTTRFRDKHGVDLRSDPAAMNRTRIKVEQAKEFLSAQSQARVHLRQIHLSADRTHFLDLDETLDQETLEELVSDLIDRTRTPCRDAMRRAKVEPRDIAEVVLVGGVTRMPMVQTVVAEEFGRIPTQRIDPVAAVALGCALQGAAVAGELKTIALNETTSMPYQVQVGNGAFVPIIRANQSLPARGERRFALADPLGEAAAVRVFHGQRRIDTLVIDDLQPSQDAPLIDLVIDVNEAGVVTTTATNVATKARIEHKLHAESGLSPDDLEAIRNADMEAA